MIERVNNWPFTEICHFNSLDDMKSLQLCDVKIYEGLNVLSSIISENDSKYI